MNIAVINIKDISKYGIKLGIIILLIYMCVQIFTSLKVSKQEKIKEGIEQSVSKVNEYSFTECLDISIGLISYKKTENNNDKFFTTNKILAMGTGIFDETNYKTIDENIDLENENNISQIEELPQNITVETVTQNNITPKYTTTYNTVQINNQSDYELTEDILRTDDLQITNKKDILIYHTHTCESYTPSPRI